MYHDVATLIAACRKGNIEANERDISPMRASGIANSIYNIGGNYVLRISHNTPEALSDVFTESVASPVAYTAGIRCPELILFDDSRSILGTPYTIYEFVPGESLSSYGKTIADNAQIYEDVGTELARLHTLVKDCPDPNNYLDHLDMLM